MSEPHQKSQFLIYRSESGAIKVDVRFEGETVWLTQQLMAELFQTTQQNISLHIQNVYEERELDRAATHKEFLSVRQEGGRQVNRTLDYFNLDVIISVGYRVRSSVATQFRIWATQRLREYIVKGFAIDYDPTEEASITFFKTVQNKMHWAITGHTAAEILHARAKPNMGLTTWRGSKVRKDDVAVAKNCLTEPELAALNNLVEQYLVFAEGQAMRRTPMRMQDWIAKLDGFLQLNERGILTHAGTISHELAQQHVDQEYDSFHRCRLAEQAMQPDDFERSLKGLPAPGRRARKRRTAGSS